MNYFQQIIGLFVLFIASMPTEDALSVTPVYGLEEKIAYQQGQFGALYEHCGSREEQNVINGSLAAWRVETFQGYSGNQQEQAGVKKSFDNAASAIMADNSSCKDWVKQAAATWQSIIFLSQHGTPVASAR